MQLIERVTKLFCI